jgi:hypothetical protein
MNVNIKVSLTDEERRVFARFLNPTHTKRLATRNDVREFVRGNVEAALHYKKTNDNDDDLITTLRKKGHNDSYIRGYLQVANRKRV